ncbi:Multidrug resistance-associated protein 1 [Giardia duodenalis]|uniref:Multidrug resistance-associated protein 1 n=1 Tax=Giardia intestinalis (strain ATCC 50803 / WB clone C6) TaxID=184922 RepID=A8B3T0_GIAIC|nr:Multidrug resistance-associated protein 1 [Giardia intestinalis]KAE8303230.1 Multidrug resistance-associated protein 1 [Giardia intestinalis]|eukprot:XP_001710303.1 Multidrug resistance-associated protein 1 [Giardia lamblia ATCC 50803]
MGIRPRVYPPPPDNAQEFTKLEAGERLAERYPRFMFYTLAWFYPVIRTASKQGALYNCDVYALEKGMTTEESIAQYLSAEAKLARHSNEGKKFPNIIRLSLQMNLRDFLLCIFSAMIYKLASLCTPITVNFLVSILSPENVRAIRTNLLLDQGVSGVTTPAVLSVLFRQSAVWVLVVVVARLVYTFFTSITFLTARKILFKTQMALQDRLFTKLLTVSELTKSSVLSGSIINFLFTDVQNTLIVIIWLPILVELLIAVIYSAIYLSLFTHPAAMMGLIAFAIAMPLSFYITSMQGRITSLYLMNSDSRIRIASEILKGIKVIKFFGQEDIHTVRLGYARKKELRYLQKLLMNEAFVYICGEVCLPMMMLFGFAALASYGLLTDAAGYSASLVFVLLAEGISFIPTALNSLIVSIISGKRINAFLSLPDVADNLAAGSAIGSAKSLSGHRGTVIQREPLGSDVAVHIKGTFTWGFAKHLQKPEILDVSYAENRASIKRIAHNAVKAQKAYESLLTMLGISYAHKNKNEDKLNETLSLLGSEAKESLLCSFTPQQIVDLMHRPTHQGETADHFALQLRIALPSKIEIPANIIEGDYLSTNDESLVNKLKRIYVQLATTYKFIDPETLRKYEVQKAIDSSPVLDGVDFSVRKGELVGIFGAVGSGKTALHMALLGELTSTDKISHGGTVAYYSQVPCVMSGTIISNIIFHKPLDEQKLAKVISLCCLDKDLAVLPSGINTEVGERGTSLSGGQKARIALARAVYADSDIYLLDDPLSAVDAHVARRLWENCILGYLIRQKQKTVLISSHQTQFFGSCDRVYEIQDKKPVERRKDDLLKRNIISVPSKLSLAASSQNDICTEASSVDPPTNTDEANKTKNIVDEQHSGKGALSKELYISWIKYGGIGKFVLCLVLYIITQLIQQFMNVFIDSWSTNRYGMPSHFYPLLYTAALVLLIGMIIVMRYLTINFSISATTKAHKSMANAILHTRMSFFETNPMGRILNRLSSDVRECDRDVYDTMTPLCELLISVSVSSLTSMIFAWPTIFAFLPVGIIFILLLRRYRMITPQVKRLSNMVTSPVITLVEEVSSNLPLVRASGMQADIQNIHRKNLSRKYAVEWMMYCCNRWASFNYSCISVLLSLALSIGVIIIAAYGDVARYVGVVLLNGFEVIELLNSVLIYSILFERSFASFERVHEYSKLSPEEADAPAQDVEGSRARPSEGEYVQISRMSFRHRKELPCTLINVNLAFRKGERIGIVGRTGAGKSSLVAALFRLAEPERAETDSPPSRQYDKPLISIDGYPIDRLPLKDARSFLTIIPQDPFVFEGTLRSSLCPYSHMLAEKIPVGEIPKTVRRHTDMELWSALEKVCLRDFFESQLEGLEAPITSCGDNLSAGQRQLVCVARALLRNAPVVILDEATAQVDRENDAIIQSTIRTALADRVVIAIAHRINTIIDFDRIIVMDAGEVKEFDTPRALLSNPESLFSKLVAECEDAEELAGIARARSE